MGLYFGNDGIFATEPVPFSATPGTITTAHATHYGPDMGIVDWLGGSYVGSVTSGSPTSYFVHVPPPEGAVTATIAVFNESIIDWNRGGYVGSLFTTPSLDGATLTESNVYDFSTSGGMVFGGAAEELRLVEFPTSGGVVFGGAAEQAQIQVYTFEPTGGMIFGGAADVETYGPQYGEHDATGGMVLGGTATYVVIANHNVSGGAVFGGSATVTYRVVSTAGNPMMLMGL